MEERLERLARARNAFASLRHRTVRDAARAVSSRTELIFASAATNILSLAMPISILTIYDRVIPNQSTHTLLVFILALGVVLILDGAFTIGRSYLTGWSAARLQHILGVTAIERLLGAEISAVESVAPGVLIQRMRAIDILKSFYAGQAMLTAIDLPFILLFLGMMGLIGRELALIPGIILCITAVVAVISGRVLRKTLEERALRDERRGNFLVEVLGKIPTVKALGLEALLGRRYERLQSASAEMSYWATFHSATARSIGGLFSQVTMVSVAAYGSTMVIAGELSTGSLAACTFLAGRSAQPMLRAFGLWTQFQSITIAAKHVTSLLELEQEQPVAVAEPRKIEGAIEIRNLAFGFHEDPTGLFSDVNFVARPGEIVGVTGPNGSGKTSLLHIMSGLLTPSAGTVLLDGLEPRHFNLGDMRAQICHIPQQAQLFQGTIEQNLTSFGGDDTLDQALVVAHALGLDEIISRLPKGFDTRVGEGANDVLPSGVRQLIGVVRALSKLDDPPIILFDEANAQLDRTTDDRLLALLKSYQGRSTIVIVSHRPSYLRLASRVYVIDHGKLREGGVGQTPVGEPSANAPGLLPDPVNA